MGHSHKKLSVQFMKDCHDEEFSASTQAELGGCLTIPTAISSMKTAKSG